MTRWLGWIFLILIVLPIAGFALWTWSALKFSYASGERAGFVQKISQKGWICKTWEGELAMMTLPGTMPQLFPFTIRDPAVAHQLERAVGQRVSLHYEQHRGVPTTCFGETEYYVTEVSVLPDTAALPIPSVPPPTVSVAK